MSTTVDPSDSGAAPLHGDAWPRANPVWLRELKQSARLTRTPFVLGTVTALTALVLCAVGGVASTNAAPAEVGVVTFHTFFSLAFAVTSWVGPGVAAMAIASERSGGTWEALLLTGMGVRSIARGKFLAALTYVGLYLVMLAPVGALPFLFGGVTATEVVAAFSLLALSSALAVGFGLSLGSAFVSPGLSAVVTLPVAGALSIFAYVAFGIGGSFAAHELWPAVSGGAPVWLPTAYVRASFGAEYVAYLCFIPLGAMALAAWFFYEATVANLMTPSEDRVTGLKRWLFVASPLLTLMAACPPVLSKNERWELAASGIAFLMVFGIANLFLLAGDALEPSARVEKHWETTQASWITRRLGPGIVTTVAFVVVLHVACIAFLLFLGIWVESSGSTRPTDDVVLGLGAVAGYAGAFLIFLGGLVVVSRAWAASGALPRLTLLLAGFGALLGPWLVLGISGVFGRSLQTYLPVAAPSPLYVLAVLDTLNGPAMVGRQGATIGAAAACIVLWTTLGIAIFAIGARRVRATTGAAARARRAFRDELEREASP